MNAAGVREEKELLGAETISKRFFPSRARSQSPQKRSRPEDDPTGDTGPDESCGRRDKRTKTFRTYLVGESVDTVAIGNDLDDEKALIGIPAAVLPTISATQNPSASITPTGSTHDSHTPQLIECVSSHNDDDIDSEGKSNFDNIEGIDLHIERLYRHEDHYQQLRRREILRRRPYHNPKLYCCNYEKAEAAVQAAIRGEKRWNAYQLCDECLGGKYLKSTLNVDGGEEEDS